MPHHRAADGALSGTALTDDTKELTGTDVKRHPLHRMGTVVSTSIADSKIVDFKDLVHRPPIVFFIFVEGTWLLLFTPIPSPSKLKERTVTEMSRPGTSAR